MKVCSGCKCLLSVFDIAPKIYIQKHCSLGQSTKADNDRYGYIPGCRSTDRIISLHLVPLNTFFISSVF